MSFARLVKMPRNRVLHCQWWQPSSNERTHLVNSWFDMLCAQKGCCQCQHVSFFHRWCTLGVDMFRRLLVSVGGREVSSSWIRRRYVPPSQPTKDTTPPNLRKCQQRKVIILIWQCSVQIWTWIGLGGGDVAQLLSVVSSTLPMQTQLPSMAREMFLPSSPL